MNRKHKLRSKQYDREETKKLRMTDDKAPPASLEAIPGFKHGSRYEPGVPMSKAELAQWRKLARRVRNRESAAASREKTRLRIEELESALNETRLKYEAALKRIGELESAAKEPLPFVDDALPTIIYTPELAPAVSPPMTPRESLSLDLNDDISDFVRPDYQQSMISRPTAD